MRAFDRPLTFSPSVKALSSRRDADKMSPGAIALMRSPPGAGRAKPAAEARSDASSTSCRPHIASPRPAAGQAPAACRRVTAHCKHGPRASSRSPTSKALHAIAARSPVRGAAARRARLQRRSADRASRARARRVCAAVRARVRAPRIQPSFPRAGGAGGPPEPARGARGQVRAGERPRRFARLRCLSPDRPVHHVQTRSRAVALFCCADKSQAPTLTRMRAHGAVCAIDSRRCLPSCFFYSRSTLPAIFTAQVALLSHLTIQGLAYLVVYNAISGTDLQSILKLLPAVVSSKVRACSPAALWGCRVRRWGRQRVLVRVRGRDAR